MHILHSSTVQCTVHTLHIRLQLLHALLSPTPQGIKLAFYTRFPEQVYEIFGANVHYTDTVQLERTSTLHVPCLQLMYVRTVVSYLSVKPHMQFCAYCIRQYAGLWKLWYTKTQNEKIMVIFQCIFIAILYSMGRLR